ncbi:choline/ethanolamine kinase-like [Panonychus citri]|uniref:choline/ethanolamine kinase-like n=1 Tax=Panonychus citri TaxID=50023 RepID=UPI002307FE3A|nr:choline/ethanolamine kinase-like [Panonychus citri]
MNSSFRVLFNGIRKMMSTSTLNVDSLRDKAFNICREYLSGSWKEIQPNDMIFHSISGGLSNILYYCSLPSTHTPLCGEPSQVLLRMYGQLHSDDTTQNENKMTESVIFMLLSERNLGPKLYGIFPGGRLEEYIPAQAMTCDQLRDPVLSSTIAHKLAHVHSLDVPINKEPTWLFDNMYSWLESARRVDLKMVKPEYRCVAKKLLSFPYEDELIWLKSFLSSVQSPVVFCHNDLQEGNILLPGIPTTPSSFRNRNRSNGSSNGSNRTLEPKVIFIDFEYCSYNHRGFDFANHFLEWTYDYSAQEWPHFYHKPENYPSESQRRHFVREYLKAVDRSRPRTEVDNEDHILREADAYSLASHLLWTLWSINHGVSSEIVFGYWEFGEMRLKSYINKKRDFTEQLTSKSRSP